MQSDLSLPNLTCPTHINELIIRVSLQDKEKQLFHCYECIKGKEKPGLVKLQDLLPELQKKYLEFSSKPPEKPLPEEAEEFIARKVEIKMGIAEQVNEYKLKADEEINKMQKEMIKLLQTARSSIDQKLDGYEDSFNNTFNEYNNLIKAYEELLANSDKPLPSQDELNKRIFSTSSSEEAEVNLKSVLGEIKARSELKEGVMLRNIEKTKNILETCKEAVFRIPEKNLEEYESKLKPLQTYLEAVVCQSKEEIQNSDEKQKSLTKQEEISKDLCKAFEKLNKVLENSNSQIKRILEEKFNVKGSGQQCTLSENGMKPVKGRSYKCYTCIEKYRDIREDEFVCEACKDNCHQGHRIELAGDGNNEFVCQCQLTMRECKLATSCTIKYTGENFIRQTYFSCRTDGMGANQCICSFCANNCHKGHAVSHMRTNTAYCDCPKLFPFCKHNQ